MWFQVRCLGEIQLYCTGAAVFCFLLSCLLMSSQMVHTFRVIFLCFKIQRHNLAFSGTSQGTGVVQAGFRGRSLGWDWGLWVGLKHAVEDGAERGQDQGERLEACVTLLLKARMGSRVPKSHPSFAMTKGLRSFLVSCALCSLPVLVHADVTTNSGRQFFSYLKRQMC